MAAKDIKNKEGLSPLEEQAVRHHIKTKYEEKMAQIADDTEKFAIRNGTYYSPGEQGAAINAEFMRNGLNNLKNPSDSYYEIASNPKLVAEITKKYFQEMCASHTGTIHSSNKCAPYLKVESASLQK